MTLQVRLIIASTLQDAPLSEHERTPSLNTYHYVNDQLSITDARAITERIARQPFGSDSQTVVVHCRQATHEAQNALLKCFEEPRTNTTVILVVPDESILLNTLRSRFTDVLMVSSESTTALAAAFLASSYKERLEEIATRVKQKDVTWMNTLIVELGTIISSRHQATTPEALKALNLAARALKNRGSSAKMLLEHVALSLPVVVG